MVKVKCKFFLYSLLFISIHFAVCFYFICHFRSIKFSILSFFLVIGMTYYLPFSVSFAIVFLIALFVQTCSLFWFLSFEGRWFGNIFTRSRIQFFYLLFLNIMSIFVTISYSFFDFRGISTHLRESWSVLTFFVVLFISWETFNIMKYLFFFIVFYFIFFF
jgi:hypothetical protein